MKTRNQRYLVTRLARIRIEMYEDKGQRVTLRELIDDRWALLERRTPRSISLIRSPLVYPAYFSFMNAVCST